MLGTLAVIHALGFSKAVIFASSGGGVISFQLAINHPEVVEHLICHEAPTMNLLPEASEIFGEALRWMEVYRNEGMGAAQKEFGAMFRGIPLEGAKETVPPEPENFVNFWENEFMVLTFFTPDLRRLVEERVSVGVMAGKESRDAWYVQTTVEQAKILGCPRFEVPGNHHVFEIEVEKFVPHLLKMIETLEERRKGVAG
jgi:pimeloyl-ACP methyl ester carboxylesterase